jgi:hypothetical protein
VLIRILEFVDQLSEFRSERIGVCSTEVDHAKEQTVLLSVLLCCGLTDLLCCCLVGDRAVSLPTT